MHLNCWNLIRESNRPDLWAKYLFAKEYLSQSRVSESTKEAYLETIKYMNGFVEETPIKLDSDQYLKQFMKLIDSIERNGFQNANGNAIILTQSNKILDGAHRIAVCAALNISPGSTIVESNSEQDYSFQRLGRLGLSENVIFNILRNIFLHNEDYRILLIFPVSPASSQQEVILRNYNNEFLYRKSFESNLNLILVSKYINYVIGSGDLEVPKWLGTQKEQFAAIHEHAVLSHGDSNLQILVVRNNDICLAVKRELRSLIGIGNYSCHSSDSQFESILLVEQFLEPKSRSLSKLVGLGSSMEVLETLRRIICYGRAQKLQNREISITGSTVLSLHGLREISDIDIIADFPINPLELQKSTKRLPINLVSKEDVDNHKDIFKKFGASYYLGLRVITLDGLKQLKKDRNEIPKDVTDLRLIEDYESNLGIEGRDDFASFIETALTSKLSWRIIRLRELVRLRVKKRIYLFKVLRFLYRFSRSTYLLLTRFRNRLMFLILR